MTNMIPFQQQQLPAFLQQAAGAANVNALAASGTGGGSVDHISLKGGRFHVVRSGQQPMTLELFNLDVIIVHANPGMTKAFYAGQWNPDESEAPICSSDDGVHPRADATQPQCASCAACPQNQFGSRINPQTGKEAKACQDKKTIAVVTPGQVSGEMLRLQVPAASLKDFGTYLRSLPNVPYFGVITRISFDTSVSFPKIKLQALDYVRDPQAFAIIQQRHESDEAKAIAGVAGFTSMRTLEAPAAPALSAPPAFMQPQAQIPVQQVPMHPAQAMAAPYGQSQPVEQAYQQVAQQFYQDAAGTVPVTAAGQPVQPQQFAQPAQQPQFQQPVAQPLSPAPAPVDPSVAAIFAGQQVQQVQQPVAQPQVQAQAPQPASNVLPSGREIGRPMPGKSRRTKAEMAEDAALGYGKAAGEQSEEEAAEVVQPSQAAPAQVAQPAFGQPPVQQPQQPVYQQPANQPQVMQGGAVNAFEGWDD